MSTRRNTINLQEKRPQHPLTDHRWVHDVYDVSIPAGRTHLVVLFTTTHLPDFILNNPKYRLREVWIDSCPGKLQSLLAGGQERARGLGWGRNGLGCLLEVTNADE